VTTAHDNHGKYKAVAALAAKMPQVLDYVTQRADHADLERMVEDWTRKGNGDGVLDICADATTLANWFVKHLRLLT